MSNDKKIIEMEKIINKYFDEITLEELFNDIIVDENVQKINPNFNLKEINIDLKKVLKDLDEKDKQKLNELFENSTMFDNFDDFIESAKRFLVLKKIKDLKLL